jgi:demethylmenaquinone methyltransferase/2-methoxy-6-polyprenyl-1,4-benzoquinol methylase/phosphoethanolamine N-methyltransferase
MTPHSHDNNHTHGADTEGKVIHWARRYDLLVNRLFGGLSHRMRVGTLRQAGLRPGSTILDFGCGAGDLAFEAERLLEGMGRIIGIDPSSEMIAVAKQKAAKRKSQVQFQAEAAEKLPFPDNTFDVVMSSFVLHHLPEDLQAKAFSELKRVLKPGGQFFAIDMKAIRLFRLQIQFHAQAPKAHRQGGLHTAAEVLREAGFREISVGGDARQSVGFVRGIK